MNKLTTKKQWILIIAGIAVLIVAVTLYFTLKGNPISEEEKQKIISSERYKNGTVVNQIDISGMNFAQATEALAPVEKQLLQNANIILRIAGEVYTLSAENMGITTNKEELLKTILIEEHEKSIFQKWVQHDSPEVKIIWDETKVKESVVAVEKALNMEAVNAEVKTDGKTLEVTEEKNGIKINTEELKNTVYSMVSKGDFSQIEVPYETVSPSITKQELERKVVKRAEFTTSFSDAPYNNINRVQNIKKCVEILHKNYLLKAGETLSLNNVLGDRTEENGWELAPGYVRGATENQPGGGVCQMSTTLYCAALKADLEIVERENHSIPVGYAKKGLDATISTGGPNLVIKNNTQTPVYILCRIEDEKLTVEIYGEPFDGFDEIKLESKKIQTIPAEGETTYKIDESKPKGYYKEIVKRRDGSVWEAYKVYFANGNRIKTETIGESKYNAYAGEVVVGP